MKTQLQIKVKYIKGLPIPEFDWDLPEWIQVYKAQSRNIATGFDTYINPYDQK